MFIHNLKAQVNHEWKVTKWARNRIRYSKVEQMQGKKYGSHLVVPTDVGLVLLILDQPSSGQSLTA